MLYREVFQEVLVFGMDLWILLAAMDKTMLGGCTPVFCEKALGIGRGRTRMRRGWHWQQGKCGNQHWCSRRPHALASYRGMCIGGWHCALSSKSAQGRRDVRWGVAGGTRGGDRRHQKSIPWKPWRRSRRRLVNVRSGGTPSRGWDRRHHR